MRFMIIVKSSAGSESGTRPSDTLLARMSNYHEELSDAGVLLDEVGLQPSATGWRIHYRDGQRHQADGPFPDPSGLIAGYTLIQVRSRDEAMEWARRFPAPHGESVECEIEVRPLFEDDDFAPA